MQRELYDIRMEFWNASYQRWLTKEFLSTPWFISIGVLIIFYVLWLIVVDRERLKEMLLFGSFVAVTAGAIDILGVTTGLWEYKIRSFPISPAIFLFDYTIIPLMYMLVLQYSTSWKKYLIGSLLAAAINCFIINPLYVKVGILKFHNFNYFYLFIIVFVLTAIVKAIYDWVLNVQQRKICKTK